VVHRRLTRQAPLLACVLLTGALMLPATAGAANRRIAIGHYQWSESDVTVNLGEHVTWYWVGPDTMHSVTGTSANDLDVDTDPGTNLPHHNLGDSFKHTFDTPGTYSFHCKLHPAVAGTITVEPTPGDPNTEPDPVPPSNVDVKAPYLSDTRLDRSSFPRPAGTTLNFSLNEKSSLDSEYYRLPGKHGGKRKFAGWRVWTGGHVGFNHVPFATRGKHFTPRPGRYVSLLRATDASNNESKASRVKFSITGR
jgi:plastocyanin